MNYLVDIPVWAIDISYLIFIIALSLILVQLIRSKNIFEKVLALDLLTAIVMCIAVAFSIEVQNAIYLEVSLCISIIAFLGTVAFARYLGRS